LLDQCAFFSGASSQGGLYKCELCTNTVTQVVCNSTLPCSEVNQVGTLNGKIVYTDAKAGKVKQCFRWKSEDRDKALRNDIFLEILGSLYDTFGIHSKGMKPEGVSLKQARRNVTKIDNYERGTVSKGKERYQLSETSTTNGPQGTVSQKTQMSVSLLKKGTDRPYMNVMDVNPEFAYDILLETLLTTQVENLHAVSHFKHETFTVLQYAQDFGTIVKESIKRTSRWAAKYYTHDKSYYPVPQSAVPLSAVATMAPLPSEGITPGMEEQIKEWLESYRPMFEDHREVQIDEYETDSDDEETE
ncbi:unnamed protein product, partial [Porites lobata]